MRIKFNINNFVKVKLTHKGKDILKKQHIEHFSKIGLLEKYPYKPCPEDENGYTEFQMWKLMRSFGDYMFNGDGGLPFETEILFDVDVDNDKKLPTIPGQDTEDLA